MFKLLLGIIILLITTGCNTVTGSIEGTALGVVKYVKTTYHYSTCIFTKTQCGDLDLDQIIFDLIALQFGACFLYTQQVVE